MNDLRLLGGVLLVSGTTIGAGMLALPIVTGFAGFIPAAVLLIAYWLYMTFTAFLMVEVNLWMDGKTNLITMARRTLGPWGKYASWVVYLFLLYTLTTAYLAGSGPIFIDFLAKTIGLKLPAWAGPLPLLGIFGFFVYKGARFVDYANRILMLALTVSFLAMMAAATPHVEVAKIERADWSFLWMGVAIVSTSFGFHIIIPTLTDYLERDLMKIRKALWFGSLIPLIVYLIWEAMTLGIIPLAGVHGIAEGYEKGLDGATLLSLYLQKGEISTIAVFFSFFAIITSFLGVSLSLKDFLADGLRIRHSRQGNLFLYLLTFGPPLLFTLSDPRAFLNALEYAGVFGVVVLLGLLPVLMVWKGRYSQFRSGEYQTPGGKGALLIALFISLGVIGLEIANKSGLIELSKT